MQGMKPINSVVIDFDGTICEFAFPDVGPPMPGVKEALEEIKAMGLRIIIHSARTSSEWGRDQAPHVRKIEDFMAAHELPYDEIWEGDKPIAIAYIDDRAIEYRGNWNKAVERVKELRNV